MIRPMAESVQIRALQKAIELAGGRRALAARLGVKAADIEKWLGGRAEVPRDVFLRVVELLVDELAPDADADEPGDPPLPRSSAAWSPQDRD
ncbi:MAG: YdaS family helix-turn-helix protein [Betaproteobacteria bacterium]